MNLTPERWARVAQIYDTVIEVPIESRDGALAAACSDDPTLRQDVESLLAQDARESPVDAPVWDTLTDVLNSETPHLGPGARIGAYVVEAVIGAGGMGEVYRARDTNLSRLVALKVLPRSWAADPDRLARFHREAQMLGALNHPNIAIIHGVEQGTDPPIRALVMELVEGPTLADRLARGPLPIEDALPIARQIAEAIEAAHEHGIVHRDLKPANIKLRADGTVKVLDFGLAKHIEPHASAVSSLIEPVTEIGAILGTAAYMSPEQARGLAADRRTDIWAFGCGLFEMLTGRRPFQGDTVSDTVAAVLRSEPNWALLPRETPQAVRRVLMRCLTKDPRERLQHIGDARLDLTDSTIDLSHGRVESRRRGWRIALGVAVVAAVGASTAIVLTRGSRSNAPSAPEMRVAINTPPTTDPLSLDLSPDGRQIAFVASGQVGTPQLWVRALDAVSSRPISGTTGARYPFWSPDGHSIGFFADGHLKRLDVASGATQTLATAIAGFGGAWGPDDVIVFIPSGRSSMWRIRASGGEPRPVTTDTAAYRAPHFLPDGNHFLVYEANTHAVYVAGLSSAARRLIDADSAAVYAASGHLLYARQGKLLAERFDVTRMELSGAPLLISDSIAVSADVGVAALTASAAGPIAYRTGPLNAPRRQLTWVDRSGRTLATLGAPDATPQLFHPSLSPDNRRVALWGSDGKNLDVWVVDSVDGRRLRVTSEPGADLEPLWSFDGNHIAFARSRSGDANEIHIRSISGSSGDQVVVSNVDFAFPVDWSRDGRFLLYTRGRPGQRDLFALALEGERRSVAVATSPYDEFAGQFAPDGKWVAYQSNESGRFEIFVQPFPGPGPKTPISNAGGTQVRWGAEGRELLYLSPDDQLMSVPVRAHADGTVAVGTATPLFATRLSSPPPGNFKQEYDVSRDGRRFLLNSLSDAVSVTPITLLLNWHARQN